MNKLIIKLKKYYLIEIILFVLVTICISMIPYLEKLFIEFFSQSKLTSQNIIFLICLFVTSVILYLLSNYLTILYAFKGSAAFERDMRDACFRNLLMSNDRIISEKAKDEYMHALTTEISQLDQDYIRPIISIIQCILQLITYMLFIFFFIDRYIAITVLSLAVLGVFLTRRIKNDASMKREAYLAANSGFIGFIRQILSAVSLVRQDNIDKVFKKEAFYSYTTAEKRLAYGRSKAALLSLNNGIGYIIMLLFFVAIVFLSYFELITVATAIVSFGYIDLVMEPISSILDSIAQKRTATHLRLKFDEYLLETDSIKSDCSTVQSIYIKDASLYSNERCIFERISYTFQAGNSYLLVGGNGSGKSSLLKVISGFQILSNGDLFVNQLRCIGGSKFSDIFYVEQSPVVFPVSFRENVTMFGSYDFSLLNNYRFMESEVIKKIMDCPNCEVLSGGEKQLLALCRSLISGAHWLLLDETFSGVSNELEYCILNEIMLSHKFHVIYVTHNTNCENLFSKKYVLQLPQV